MERRRTRIGLAALLALGAVVVPARAETTSRLGYERLLGAESCPDEAALRAAVAVRLGEDPFTPAAPRIFRITISVREGRLLGTVELETSEGVEGRREFEAGPDACAELVEAMALAVSLTINPNLVVEPSPATDGGENLVPPAPPASPTPPEALAPSEAPAPLAAAPPAVPTVRASRPPPAEDAAKLQPASEEEVPLGFGAGAAAHGAFGTGPGTAAGGSVMLRVEKGWWQVGIEGRVDALSRADIGRNGTVHSTLVAGVFAPCARFRGFAACSVLLLGSIFAESEGVVVERSDRGFFSAAGARFSTGTALGAHLWLEARLDALHALTPVTIELDGKPAWRAGASGALGMGLVWTFP